jgi:hypothetical protein
MAAAIDDLGETLCPSALGLGHTLRTLRRIRGAEGVRKYLVELHT